MSSAVAAMLPLNEKQKSFVKHFVLLQEGKAAVIAAGYGKNSAAVQAYKLLQNPAVRREIAKAMAVLRKQYEAQLDAAMGELVHCLTRRATDMIDPKTGRMLDLHQLPERIDASIDGYEEDHFVDKQGNHHVKKKVKLVSKATAIDMALRIKGAYAPDKVDVRAQAKVDLTQLYGMPDGALDPDRIEVED